VTLKLAVLVSGSGSNLQSIIDAVGRGALEADIKLVLSNNPEAYGLTRAADAGIQALALDHRAFADRAAFDQAMIEAIREAGADTVALAGFMRRVTPAFLEAFPGRVLNIHPALLPSFPGVHGQRDAADYGVRVSGCTVHFVDEKVDHGPIVIQAVVPAYPEDDGDSLGRRILALEHRIYPQALQWLAAGRLEVAGRKVNVRGAEFARAVIDANGDYMVSPGLDEGF
jgi:phosphoribosylglycinamide formyltransferase-1